LIVFNDYIFERWHIKCFYNTGGFFYFTTLLVYRTVASMLRLLSGDMETIVQEKQLWADRGIVQTFAWTD